MPNDSEKHELENSPVALEETVQSVDDGSLESATPVESEEVASVPLTGYELVSDLMRRQDEVIQEIDLLNLRIEAAIKQAADARKQDLAAESTELDVEDDRSDTAQPSKRNRQAA